MLALDADDPFRSMSFTDWDNALEQYYDEHDGIGLGADARGPALHLVTEHGRRWEVRQIVDDPAGNHDWSITATVDLDACDEAGDLILHVTGFARLDD